MISRVFQFNYFVKVAAGRWYLETTQVLDLLTVGVLRFRISRSETNKMERDDSGSMLVKAGTCASEKIGRWEVVIYLLRCLPQVGRYFDDVQTVK